MDLAHTEAVVGTGDIQGRSATGGLRNRPHHSGQDSCGPHPIGYVCRVRLPARFLGHQRFSPDLTFLTMAKKKRIRGVSC